MKWFPQAGAGTLAQLPLRLARTWRAIRNVLENGERVVLPDTGYGQIEWRLSFHDLSQPEAQRLEDLFVAMQGSYGTFGFVDPTANLIASSEDLARPDWQAGLLAIAGGAADPLGATGAWVVSNGSAGEQLLTQTVAVPGEYTGCFSAWVRCDTTGSITLRRDGTAITAGIGPSWKRLFVSGAGTAGADHSDVSIELTAGQNIELWGLQFEAQPYPSRYKQSRSASGIYEETYFGTDELKVTSTGVDLSACEITLISKV